MLYAMIDIGSNTIRMAVYEIDGDRVEMQMKRKHTVGLASYVRDGILQRAGIDKVVEIIGEYRNFLEELGIHSRCAGNFLQDAHEYKYYERRRRGDF